MTVGRGGGRNALAAALFVRGPRWNEIDLSWVRAPNGGKDARQARGLSDRETQRFASWQVSRSFDRGVTSSMRLNLGRQSIAAAAVSINTTHNEWFEAAMVLVSGSWRRGVSDGMRGSTGWKESGRAMEWQWRRMQRDLVKQTGMCRRHGLRCHGEEGKGCTHDGGLLDAAIENW